MLEFEKEPISKENLAYGRKNRKRGSVLTSDEEVEIVKAQPENWNPGGSHLWALFSPPLAQNLSRFNEKD